MRGSVIVACTTCDLREKDVVNVRSGDRMGQVSDFEIDPDCGRITAILVTPDSLSGMLFSKNTTRVPWECIVRIGKDVILVDSPVPCGTKPDRCSTCRPEKGIKKWFG